MFPCEISGKYVAPFAGAWIEILAFLIFANIIIVAPFAGAWIEMKKAKTKFKSGLSLPSRERGLKFGTKYTIYRLSRVAPFAGAWIEIIVSSP